jgi:hypothetical protein
MVHLGAEGAPGIGMVRISGNTINPAVFDMHQHAACVRAVIGTYGTFYPGMHDILSPIKIINAELYDNQVNYNLFRDNY